MLNRMMEDMMWHMWAIWFAWLLIVAVLLAAAAALAKYLFSANRVGHDRD